MFQCSYEHHIEHTLKHTTEEVMIINNKKIFFFLLAGYLMRVPDNDVRNQLVDTVKSFYISIAPEELLDGMELLSKPKPRTFNSDIYFSRLSLSEGSFMASLYLHLICFFSCQPGLSSSF